MEMFYNLGAWFFNFQNQSEARRVDLMIDQVIQNSFQNI